MMDKESGIHHLAHRICCDLFLLQIDMEQSDAEKACADAEKAWENQCQKEPLKEAVEAQNRQVKAMAPYAGGFPSLSNEVGDGDA